MKQKITFTQFERQDFVDNACFNLLKELSGKDLEWDINLISQVRDSVQDILVDQLKIMDAIEFYPYIEE